MVVELNVTYSKMLKCWDGNKIDEKSKIVQLQSLHHRYVKD